ncbi:replication factor C subunit 3/5 [Pancytospora philotis]|nr:replication factor C subunit 3/5 [Pancytospora philotis]
MLWIEKHRPKTFAEITTHAEVVRKLQTYTLESVPNIVFHGQPGHNRRTILYALVGHLFGQQTELKQKSMEIKHNSTTISVSYLESDEVISITPSDYGNRDRLVVQSIIKEMAQTRPILSMFGAHRHSVKIIVINQAESLSRDAQAALRRTMEVYSSHFRIFMICTEVSRLMEPIRSRALFFRVRGFTQAEIVAICGAVVTRESYSLDHAALADIAANANGNMQRALCLCEMHCLNTAGKDVKKAKVDLANYRLEWEAQIEAVVALVRNQPRVENFAKIRKELYALLVACISPSVILLRMARALESSGFATSKKIAEAALRYDERIKTGSKHLLHLEAFAAAAMYLYAQKLNG